MGGPMCTASSANFTTADSASAVEYNATLGIPSSRAARATRSAISPRLAITIFCMFVPYAREAAGQLTRVDRLEHDQLLSVLDHLAVGDEDRGHAAGTVDFDPVHQLHGLDDPDRLAGLDDVALFDERLRGG